MNFYKFIFPNSCIGNFGQNTCANKDSNVFHEKLLLFSINQPHHTLDLSMERHLFTWQLKEVIEKSVSWLWIVWMTKIQNILMEMLRQCDHIAIITPQRSLPIYPWKHWNPSMENKSTLILHLVKKWVTMTSSGIVSLSSWKNMIWTW